MYVKSNIDYRLILRHLWNNLIVCTICPRPIVFTYNSIELVLLKIPFLPLRVIGTMGFKNNQSYDRFWEVKLGNRIINYSRSCRVQVLNFIQTSYQKYALLGKKSNTAGLFTKLPKTILDITKTIQLNYKLKVSKIATGEQSQENMHY